MTLRAIAFVLPVLLASLAPADSASVEAAEVAHAQVCGVVPDQTSRWVLGPDGHASVAESAETLTQDRFRTTRTIKGAAPIPTGWVLIDRKTVTHFKRMKIVEQRILCARGAPAGATLVVHGRSPVPQGWFVESRKTGRRGKHAIIVSKTLRFHGSQGNEASDQPACCGSDSADVHILEIAAPKGARYRAVCYRQDHGLAQTYMGPVRGSRSAARKDANAHNAKFAGHAARALKFP